MARRPTCKKTRRRNKCEGKLVISGWDPSFIGDPRIWRVLFSIRNEPNHQWKITELALMVDLSTSHLGHLFKIKTGGSLGQYLKSAQMCRAKELLRQRTLSVKEVMFKAGFASRSHFSKDFKLKYGVSPKGYQLVTEGSGTR
jgi:AraC-like DNA-binding protein